MKFFSLESLSKKASDTVFRFPLTMAAAFAATLVMLLISHADSDGPWLQGLYKTAMTCYLVMLLSISVVLYAERFGFSTLKKNSAYILVILPGVLYFYSFPDEVNIISYTRFALYAIGLHLLIAFVPFMRYREINGLWQFNKHLFIRILTAALYSGVLYLGLAVALLSIDYLFGAQIEDEIYFDLWILISGLFNTWFFLAGVPENLSSLEEEKSYPKGLKIFTVYILLPLVCIYLAILYVYGLKILITGEWPEDGVALLVIIFSVFGILSFLLIHPLRNDESQRWVKSYSRLFYFLLMPLVILLFFAIMMRVNMYGITEDRYFVIVLACWLAFISLYMILTSGKNIRIIPVSLCIIAFLSSFGPWSAFSVSRRSQMKELTILLDKYHALKDGMIDTTKSYLLPEEDYRRIGSIINYIDDVHGHGILQPLIAQKLDTVSSWDIMDVIKIYMYDIYEDSLEAARQAQLDSGRYFSIAPSEMISSAGYDFINEISLSSYRLSDTFKLRLKKDTLYFSYSQFDRKFNISFRNFDPLSLDAGNVLDSIYMSEKSSLAGFVIENDNSEWKAKMIFSEIQTDRVAGRTIMSSADVLLFVKLSAKGENEVGERKE